MASDPGLTIILVGNTGVGKSASGNTILGRTAFMSKLSFRSVTTMISEATGTVFGKQISVVDTPGILGSEREIQNWCRDMLQSSRPCLFLVVVKVDRFTIEQKTAVEAALRVIGDQGFSRCFLLFTSGDVLNNQSLDDFISQDPDGPLTPVVERFAGRVHLFNNPTGGPEQVRVLLEKSGHLTVADHPRLVKRMVLLGLPGGGKSSSGNTILGSDEFVSGCDFNPVSTVTVSKSAMVEGHEVTVVDTPGLIDEVLTPKQLYNEIMKSIDKSSPGPHAFIIVVRIGRITPADAKVFMMLQKLFGDDACRYSMVLFTHGDQLGDRSIAGLIQSNSYMPELVSMCGGRYCVFDNSRRGNRVQVRNLLDRIDEMVTANGGEYCTSIQRPPTLKQQILDWFTELLKEIARLLGSVCDWFSSSGSHPRAFLIN